jgi:hypothetical protein
MVDSLDKFYKVLDTINTITGKYAKITHMDHVISFRYYDIDIKLSKKCYLNTFDVLNDMLFKHEQVAYNIQEDKFYYTYNGFKAFYTKTVEVNARMIDTYRKRGFSVKFYNIENDYYKPGVIITSQSVTNRTFLDSDYYKKITFKFDNITIELT